jgi:hypothetical protein
VGDAFVFKGADGRIRFTDGNRDPDKVEENFTFTDGDLAIREKRDFRYHRNRGGADHRRMAVEETPLEAFFSWRFCNVDLYLFVNQNLSAGVSTSAPGDNLCTAPYDYNDAAWTKSNITLPIGDDDLSPGGAMTAKRIEPTGAGGYIQYQVSYNPALNEWVYIDFWTKALVAHTAVVEVSQTYHGVGPPPDAYSMEVAVTPRGWVKHTTGYQNESTILDEETLTLKIYPDQSGTDSLDLWEVFIRRDVPSVKSWDMYVDIYKDGSVDRSIVLEHAAYRTASFTEGGETSIWSTLFDFKKTFPVEVFD